MQYDILWFVILIGLNVLIDYMYSENILFPVLFMLFEIIYGISIIANNEIFIACLMVFGTIYNGLLIFERRGKYINV